VVWANGTAPTLTGVNGYADVYALTSYKGTSGSWIGTVLASKSCFYKFIIMTSIITQISNPWSLPKLNVSVQPTLRYEWTQGYGGQKLLGNDLSGNNYNANMYGFGSSDYYPVENGGLIKLNNLSCNGSYYMTTPINPSVNEYSFFMGFRLDAIQNSGCFNAEIFTGAYAFSTHDWWCGIQGTTIIFSRNGNLISTGITAVIGRFIYNRIRKYLCSRNRSIWIVG
jgi:hypothetical protein